MKIKAYKVDVEEMIRSAGALTYDPAKDILRADGIVVGGADAMTRELMLSMVDESWHGDDDETLFDALVDIP